MHSTRHSTVSDRVLRTCGGALAPLLGVALAACGGPPEPVEGPSTALLEASWVGHLVSAPERFTELVDTNRMGWSALHANRLPGARLAGGVPGSRAAAELAELYGDLARVDSLAWQAMVETWEGRSGLPEGSAVTWFVGLAALESGNSDQAQAWFNKAAQATDPVVAQAAKALAAQAMSSQAALAEPLSDTQGNALLERVDAHREARRSVSLKGLLEEGQRPIWEETSAAGHQRSFYDPQLNWTAEAVLRSEASRSTVEGMDALLFSGCLTVDDQVHETARIAAGGGRGTLCALAPSWAAVGVNVGLGDTDDAEHARGIVRALDAAVDPWRKSLADGASDDGAELLAGLNLPGVLRSRFLLALSRHCLGAGHPRQALAVVQMAMDLEHPRQIGPLNPPGFYAVTAEAQLMTGHTREALDALQVLSDAYPELAGVDEVVGDLAILQGLDRHGDSKEN